MVYIGMAYVGMAYTVMAPFRYLKAGAAPRRSIKIGMDPMVKTKIRQILASNFTKFKSVIWNHDR